MGYIRDFRLKRRYKNVKFYNASLTEVQDDVSIGEGTRIGTFTLIQGNAKIGKNCTIGSFCNICSGVEIGDNVSIQTACHITKGVKIASNSFIGPGVITLNDKYMDDHITPPTIASKTRIGGGTVILPDVHIGSGVIVGSGSIVTRNLDDNEIVYGNPARSKDIKTHG
jgi:UDP-2-acetamido-3-amino-2,3-dideoxy-glucuronate N-acetyltransferase